MSAKRFLNEHAKLSKNDQYAFIGTEHYFDRFHSQSLYMQGSYETADAQILWGYIGFFLRMTSPFREHSLLEIYTEQIKKVHLPKCESRVA